VSRMPGHEPLDHRAQLIRRELGRELIQRPDRHRRIRQRVGGRQRQADTLDPRVDLVSPVRLLDGRSGRRAGGLQVRAPQPGDEVVAGRRQPGGAQRDRGVFQVADAPRELVSAAGGRRGGVVELVRESGRELAQRQHLFLVEVARREVPGAVQHCVHASRRQVVAVANHPGKVPDVDLEDLGVLLVGDRARSHPQA
jgi:hypothetical protein